MNKFGDIVLNYNVLIETDHQAILGLMEKPKINSQLARLELAIEEYHPKFIHRPRQRNDMARHIESFRTTTSS